MKGGSQCTLWWMTRVAFVVLKKWMQQVQWYLQKQLPRGVLRKRCSEICSKFTGEHPCRSAISIKLLCNFIEIAGNRTSLLVFSCTFAAYLQSTFSQEHVWLAAAAFSPVMHSFEKMAKYFRLPTGNVHGLFHGHRVKKKRVFLCCILTYLKRFMGYCLQIQMYSKDDCMKGFARTPRKHS